MRSRRPAPRFRRWAFESAALDLALREAGHSRTTCLGSNRGRCASSIRSCLARSLRSGPVRWRLDRSRGVPFVRPRLPQTGKPIPLERASVDPLAGATRSGAGATPARSECLSATSGDSLESRHPHRSRSDELAVSGDLEAVAGRFAHRTAADGANEERVAPGFELPICLR